MSGPIGTSSTATRLECHWRVRRRSHPMLQLAAATLAAALAAWLASAAEARGAAPLRARTVADSQPPSWPRSPQPPQGAPNVLVILTDDVGFGASSTFGGPIPTPTFDALAREGLSYNRFHTSAVCSPTRASLLTGRYPHNVGVGNTTNLPTGYPGYTSVIPKSAATIAQLLRSAGWATAMFGKAHITPEWELSQAGPFDRWPTGLGFDYFYGFLGADTSAFEPALVENTRPVSRPRVAAGGEYHLEGDLADRAIAWLESHDAVAPRTPVFIYYATGAAHAPNHAPAEWIARFRGQFDAGWDQLRAGTWMRQKSLGVIPRNAGLSPRPATLPAWNSLPRERRRVYARFMEAYAASLAYTDAQIGRVIEAFRRTGRHENTLVIYVQGDNGASTEGRLHGRVFEQSGINNLDEDPHWVSSRIDDIGGPGTYPLLSGGWGWALNAPFPWAKRAASHLGGIRNAMVIAWPQRIAPSSVVRSQFHHVSDLMPTILEATGVAAPEVYAGVVQQPIDGISLAYTFSNPRAPDRRRSQVFESFENLALYEAGWMLSSTPVSTPWDATPAPRVPLDRRRWELYHLDQDFSQTRDLAQRDPRRLAALQQRFWEEAGRHNILPVHAPDEGNTGVPSLAGARRVFAYPAGVVDIPESAAPPTMRRAHTITADVVIPSSGADGVLVAQGGRFGGYALYVRENRPVFAYNAVPPRLYSIRADQPLTPGAHRIVVRVLPDSGSPGAPASVTLTIDGAPVASGRVEQTLSTWISHSESFDVGEDRVTAVSPEYTPDGSRFSGELRQLLVTLD